MSNDGGEPDNDPELRRRMVSTLPTSVEADREERLLRRLGDDDWRVRKEAARVASLVAEEWKLLPTLVDGLCQSENVGLRNAALEVLEHIGAASADALLEGLATAPPSARKFMVAALGFAGNAGAERLAELSNDPDPNTAQAALEALARTGGPIAEAALRGHLTSDDPVQRLAALEGLERIEAQLSMSVLEPLLSDRLVRRTALRLLGFIDDPQALTRLIDAIGEGRAAAKQSVIALGRQMNRGGPVARALKAEARDLGADALDALWDVAQHESGQVRRASTAILLFARDVRAIPYAAELDADEGLSPPAIEALRRWGTDAIEPLLAIIDSVGPRAGAAALELAADLGAAGSPSDELITKLRVALRAALEAEDAPPAAAAARAMETWAEPQDAVGLVTVARRFEHDAAGPAGRALGRLASTDALRIAEVLSAITLDGPLAAALAPAMAALGGATAEKLLSATLKASDPRARRAAVHALQSLEGEQAAELAGFALADENVDVQAAAVSVLGRLRSPDGSPLGIEPLRLSLRSPAGPVVTNAAQALGELGETAAAPFLRDLVSDPRPGVAVAALESLRVLDQLRSEEALLVEALSRPDDELVKVALRVMASAPNEHPSVAEQLWVALEHSAWDVRKLAATLLFDIGGPAAEDRLRAHLENETDVSVRRAIETRLGGQG